MLRIKKELYRCVSPLGVRGKGNKKYFYTHNNSAHMRYSSVNNEKTMKNNFTNELLLQFIYKECTPAEEAFIIKGIMNDADLASEYHTLLAAVSDLNSVSEEPSQTSVDIILNYAMEGVEHE